MLRSDEQLFFEFGSHARDIHARDGAIAHEVLVSGFHDGSVSKNAPALPAFSFGAMCFAYCTLAV